MLGEVVSSFAVVLARVHPAARDLRRHLRPCQDSPSSLCQVLYQPDLHGSHPQSTQVSHILQVPHLSNKSCAKLKLMISYCYKSMQYCFSKFLRTAFVKNIIKLYDITQYSLANLVSDDPDGPRNWKLHALIVCRLENISIRGRFVCPCSLLAWRKLSWRLGRIGCPFSFCFTVHISPGRHTTQYLTADDLWKTKENCWQDRLTVNWPIFFRFWQDVCLVVSWFQSPVRYWLISDLSFI